MEIHKTTKYERFKFINSNRTVNHAHVLALSRSIQGNNLLERRPIEVNEKMEVIDGQHRLEAAKLLKLPIYYMVIEGFSAQDIITLNTVVKIWDVYDYAQHWVSQGDTTYLEYLKFRKDYGLPHYVTLALLADTLTTITKRQMLSALVDSKSLISRKPKESPSILHTWLYISLGKLTHHSRIRF